VAVGQWPDLDGAPLYKSHSAAQLYDATEAAVVAEAIKELSAQAGTTPSLIIIDTLARNHGGDENSTQDMNAFIQHLDTYLRQPWKCCVWWFTTQAWLTRIAVGDHGIEGRTGCGVSMPTGFREPRP
jgi:hypothetical protein